MQLNKQTSECRSWSGRDKQRRRLRLVGMMVACAVLLIVAALAASPLKPAAAADNPAKNGPDNGPDAGTQTRAPATFTPVPTGASTRWEAVALSELADSLGWPPTVSQDDSGKLSIALVISSTEQASISIRPFDFTAGAQAAFDAEQEDALLAGLQVSTGRFDGYPSYGASLRQDGVTVERRLHWLAGEWILAVDTSGRGQVMQALDPAVIAGQLLYIALQNGLPSPPGGSPTPLPTNGRSPTATPTLVDCGLAFSDVTPEHWAYAYITELSCSGVIAGYTDGTFRPQNATTRAQLAKMLVISEGWALSNPAQPSFLDVDASHLFYRYIETAYAHGVIAGFPGHLFMPDAYVTRAEVAKMLVRARGWSLAVQNPIALCDVPADHWAWAYVQVAVQHRAFSGYANGCFLPDAYATRAQLAKVISQAHR